MNSRECVEMVRKFIKIWWQPSLIFWIILLVLISPVSASERKPNRVLIFSDDLSYRDLSSYGQKNFSTPNIDELAVGGIRFTQTYSGSPECAPSRGSLLTGMHMGHCRL